MMYNRIFKRGSFLIILVLIFTYGTHVLYAEHVYGSLSQESKSVLRFNMSYIHFNNKSEYIDYVNSTEDTLSEVAPNYFNIDGKGNLVITNLIDKDFIDEMHKRGIRVVPYLSNNWNRTAGRLALMKRVELAEQIAAVIEKYDLDGINVDIEDLTEADRDRHTDFIARLRQSMGDEKTIAVAVSANPKAKDTGWAGSYDYEALAQYADYLMLMAYDEHYKGSEPGPVAGIDFVEKSIKYALTKVSPDKIVLGIPFYGRIWKSGGGISGQGLSLLQVQGLISNYKSSIIFSSANLAPRATINIKTNDKKPSIAAGVLGSGTYTVWYEDEKSLKYKLDLVERYDLKGTGSWSLGQEPSSVWNYYGPRLNGYDLKDISDHNYKNEILYGFKKGFFTTETLKDKSLFGPDENITRADAVYALTKLFYPQQKNSSEEIFFTDIEGHCVYEEICIAASNGIIRGNGSGDFNPDSYVTKEELAVMIDRVFYGRDIVYASRSSYSDNVGKARNFTDVSRELSGWSYHSIDRTARSGILSPVSETRFDPKKLLTKGELAEILFRLDSN